MNKKQLWGWWCDILQWKSRILVKNCQLILFNKNCQFNFNSNMWLKDYLCSLQKIKQSAIFTFVIMSYNWIGGKF